MSFSRFSIGRSRDETRSVALGREALLGARRIKLTAEDTESTEKRFVLCALRGEIFFFVAATGRAA